MSPMPPPRVFARLTLAERTTINDIRTTARDLAVRIQAGLFDALDADMRCDLRALTIAMAGWANELEGRDG